MRIVGKTSDGRPVVSGEDIFAAKDTHGFPLAMAFVECHKLGWEIDWVGFISCARNHGWWDFQILESMEEAFCDSGVWADRREPIEMRAKIYISTHPHPKMERMIET